MPPDLLWRGGAGRAVIDAEPAPPREPSNEELATLEDLSDPAPPVHSIARLVERKRAAGTLDKWKRSVAALPGTDTLTLILRLSTTADPLMAWALHVCLDKRGVAPCLRWPANSTTPQMMFVAWAGDVFWLTRRNRTHCAKFQSWQRLMQVEPGSAQWLELAYRIFAGMYGRQNIASYTARGLALAPEQRQPLMTLPTTRMIASRLELQPTAFADIRQRLLSHAMAYPDKSRTRSPEAVGNRRALLWRAHVLLGRRPAETARNWAPLTGETTTRQVIARQIGAIETALAA